MNLSVAKIHIDGCDYWGTYGGYPVYRCFKSKLPAYEDIVFALGSDLYLNGIKVGFVDSKGTVSRWNPAVARKKKKEEPTTKATMTFEFKGEDIKSGVSDIDADKIIANSWKRSVEDLIGEKFSE